MQTITTQIPDRAYFDAIATHMGGWQVTEETSWDRPTYQLVYTGTEPTYHGAKLYSHGDQRAHKIEWRCGLHIPCGTGNVYIMDALPSTERTSLNLSANIGLTKCPAKVAQELERRLLPRYLALYAKGMAQVAATLDQDEQDAKLAQKLAAILGTPARHQYTQESKPWTVDIPGGARVLVEHGGMRFQYAPSFSAEQAMQLCTLFATWQRSA